MGDNLKLWEEGITDENPTRVKYTTFTPMIHSTESEGGREEEIKGRHRAKKETMAKIKDASTGSYALCWEQSSLTARR